VNQRNSLPPTSLRRAFGFLFQNFSVFLQCALLPLFVNFAGYLLQTLWKSDVVAAVVGILVFAVMGAYLGVRWVRFALLKEAPVVARFGILEQRFLMVTVLFFMGNQLILIVLGSLGRALPVIVLLPIASLAGVFLLARLSFLFIDAALGVAFQLPKIWRQTAKIWPPLFGKLLCINLLVYGLVGFLHILLQGQQSAMPKTLEGAMALLSSNSWLNGLGHYVQLVVSLSVVGQFYKRVKP